jgi:hypothetical protein
MGFRTLLIRLSVDYIGISETINEDLGKLFYRVYVQPNRPDNIEIEPEDEADTDEKAIIFFRMEWKNL